MSRPIASQKRSAAIAVSVFIVGLLILSYLNVWWPGIMLVIGLPLALKQYLLGKKYDMAITLFVFCGVFITVQFDIDWKLILPVLFTIGGIQLFCRDCLESFFPTEAEKEKDVNEEIEEKQNK